MFLEISIIGVLAAFLTIFLNYTIGKPGSEKFSPYEIFSFYTVWLSKRRLKNVGILCQYESQYEENNERIKSRNQHITLKNDYRKIYYEAAEPFFTWERAFGMCPVCFGFWVAVIVNFYCTEPFINSVCIILISHIVIRLLRKII